MLKKKVCLFIFILFSLNFSFGQPSLNFTIASANGYTLTCSKPSLTLSITTNTTNSVLCTWNSLANGTVTGNPVVINNPDSYTISVQDLVTTETKTQALSVFQDTVAPSAFGPTATITFTCPTIDQDYPITLTPSFPTGTINYAFTWTANTLGIMTPPNSCSVIINSTDIYTCTVTNSVNGCSTEVTFSVSCFVGLQELQTSSLFVSLNPNPFRDKLDFYSTGQCTIIVLDCMGRIVYEGRSISKSVIDLSFLSSGLYFLTAKGKDSSRTLKIIKE